MTWDSRIVSPEELAVLDRLATPMWIYDPETQVRHWANASALRLWGAESLEALLANETPMVSTDAIERRLQAITLVRNPSAIAAFGTGPTQIRAPDSIATPHVREALTHAAKARTPYAAVAEVHTLNGLQTHQIDARPTIDPATGTPPASC